MRAADEVRAEVQGGSRSKPSRRRIPPPPSRSAPAAVKPPPPPMAAKSVRDSIDGRRAPAPPPPSRQQMRGAAREAYTEQTPAQRKETLAGAQGQHDPFSGAVTKLHGDWARSQHYVDQAAAWLRSGAHPVADQHRAEGIAKGLHIIGTLHRRQQRAEKAALAPLRFGPAPGLLNDLQARTVVEAQRANVEQPHKSHHHGPLHVVTEGVGAIGKIPISLNPWGSAHSLSGEVTQRVGDDPPVDRAQLLTLKGTFDATSKALDQTTRLSSASAGAALALAEGGNPLKGAAQGFLKNDKSYTQLAKKLGLHGIPAAVAGTVGDILLDPTTYLSLGAKTPAEAAELAARAKLARKLRGPMQKAVKAGDQAEVERLAAKWEDEIKQAKASASRLEGGTRGIQVGVRIPGVHIPKVKHVEGRTVATGGRLSAKVASKFTAPVARDVQQARPVNELLRLFSPAQTPTHLDRLAHREFRHIEREASALEGKLAREGRQLGRLIANTTKGDVAQVRAIKDAIETGTIDQLPKDLRKVAEHAQRFHEQVAAKYEEITGKPLDLLGTVLKKGEVDEALKTARDVLHQAAGKVAREGTGHAAEADKLAQRIAVDDAKRAGATAAERRNLASQMEAASGVQDRILQRIADGTAPEGFAKRFDQAEQRIADLRARHATAGPEETLAQALRKFEHAALTQKAARTLDDAEQLAGRLEDVVTPRTVAEQEQAAHRIVTSLQDVLEAARAGVRTNVARGRTNDVLGAVRRGEVDNAELAAALADSDRLTAEVRAARAAGDRTAARAAESKLRQARQVIRSHRDEIHARIEAEVAAEPVKLSGKAGKLEDQLDGMLSRLAEQAPVGYVPRKPQVYAEAMLDPTAARKAPLAVRSQAQAGPEMARVDRRLESVIREDPNVPDELRPSDELPILEAKYGAVMGRRLANLSLYKAVIERFSAPASTRVLHEAQGARIFRVEPDGKITPVPDSDIGQVMADAQAAEARAAADGTEAIYHHIVVPEGIAKQLEVHTAQHGDRNYWAGRYDAMLRAFKASNTILRPAFFATSVLGNMWQGFLVDATAHDFAHSFRVWSRLRRGTRDAIKGGTRIGDRLAPDGSLARRFFDEVVPGKSYIVDGRPVSYGELFDEALEHGAVRTGSRLGDALELSLEQQASREVAGGAFKHGVEWLNQLAEDVDDVTRMTLYARARSKLGMSPRQATEYVFSTMIDYGDLTPFERKVMKRVMPFYVYTSRNLPIQVRRLLARPGKLATFEKVRQNLATAAGLPQGWESMLAEGDQERMPFPVPGLKLAGHQWYEYLRLPVEDISRPLQLFEGLSGAKRMVERYAGDMAPPIKALPELYFNKRFDYDRPISLPGSPPPSGILERFAGLAQKNTHIDPRTGKPFHGVNADLDYLLRSFGGSFGAAALNAGKETPDSSGISPAVRAGLSLFAGQGANAPDPLQAVALPKVSQDLQNLYNQRTDLGHQGKAYTAGWYQLQDQIQATKALKDVVRAAIGYPDAKKKLPKMRMDRVNHIMSGLKTPRERAMEHKIDAILNP